MKHTNTSDRFHDLRLLAITLLFIGGSALMISCEKKGPMERAGENMDEAAEDIGDSVEDATN